MAINVNGKVAMITGAASGIGLACAKTLAESGASVVLTDIDAGLGEAARQQIRESGGTAEFFSMDITSEEQWVRVLAHIVDTLGGLDVLVNNAGIFSAVPLLDISLDHWRRVHQVNLDGTFLGIREAVRMMQPGGKAGNGGSIVNISSCAGLRGSAGHAAYCSSKAGVHLLTQAAAVECGAMGIRINSVHPAIIQTPMVDEAKKIWAQALTDGDVDAMDDHIAKWHPIGRVGAPQDVADAVLYLASDASSFCTGGEIKVDGGYCAKGQ